MQRHDSLNLKHQSVVCIESHLQSLGISEQKATMRKMMVNDTMSTTPCLELVLPCHFLHLVYTCWSFRKVKLYPRSYKLTTYEAPKAKLSVRPIPIEIVIRTMKYMT